MTKLIYSSETIGCGATFILESNEYCSISVARSGVLVRSHQAHFFARVFGGFFGPILYNERNVYMAENVAMWLNSLFPERNPSLIFRNPLLTAFAHAVWHCSSAAEVSIVLNEANKEVALATEQPSGHQATRPSREDILGDYAAFMEHNTSHPTTIEDVSVLPHSKEIILDALLVEIGRGH